MPARGMASVPSIPGAIRSRPSVSIAQCARCVTPGSICRAIAAAACLLPMLPVAPRFATTIAAVSTKPRRWARPASCLLSEACRNIRGREARLQKISCRRVPRSTTPWPRCWNTPNRPRCRSRSSRCIRPMPLIGPCVNTTKQALDICDRLTRMRTGALGVALDVYHIWWDPELLPQIARAGKDRLLAFHVCDWLVPTKDILNDRGMMGDGVIDIKSARPGGRGARLCRLFGDRDFLQ